MSETIIKQEGVFKFELRLYTYLFISSIIYKVWFSDNKPNRYRTLHLNCKQSQRNELMYRSDMIKSAGPCD